MRPPERDYSHRGVVDKLGVKLGHVVAFDAEAWPIDAELRAQILARAGEDDGVGAVDVVVASGDDATDAVALLTRWAGRLVPNGGIWILTPKRGCPGYVSQNLLIQAGVEAGLVDNKVCSVSDTVSAMRFVIRRKDRPPASR